eukprot:5669875-Alexandrium_andersonii.AAC.1
MSSRLDYLMGERVEVALQNSVGKRAASDNARNAATMNPPSKTSETPCSVSSCSPPPLPLDVSCFVSDSKPSQPVTKKLKKNDGEQ